MATPQEIRQQLAEKEKEILARKQEIELFDPRITQTYSQLLRATPLTQALIKTQEEFRKKAKETAFEEISRIEQEFTKQKAEILPQVESYEQAYEKEQQSYELARKKQEDYKLGFRLGQQGKSIPFANKDVQRGYRDAKALGRQQLRRAELEKAGLKPIYAGGKLVGFEDVQKGMSYKLESLQKYREIDLPKLEEIGLISIQPIQTPKEIELKVSPVLELEKPTQSESIKRNVKYFTDFLTGGIDRIIPDSKFDYIIKDIVSPIKKRFESAREERLKGFFDKPFEPAPVSPLAEKLKIAKPLGYTFSSLEAFGRGGLEAIPGTVEFGFDILTRPIPTTKETLKGLVSLPEDILEDPFRTGAFLAGGLVLQEAGLGLISRRQPAVIRSKPLKTSRDISLEIADAVKIGETPVGDSIWKVETKIKTSVRDPKGKVLDTYTTRGTGISVTARTQEGAIKSATELAAASLRKGSERQAVSLQIDKPLLKITKKFDVAKGTGEVTLRPRQGAERIFEGVGDTTIREFGTIRGRMQDIPLAQDPNKIEAFIKLSEQKVKPLKTAKSDVVVEILGTRPAIRRVPSPKRTKAFIEGEETFARVRILTDVYPETIRVKGYKRTPQPKYLTKTEESFVKGYERRVRRDIKEPRTTRELARGLVSSFEPYGQTSGGNIIFGKKSKFSKTSQKLLFEEELAAKVSAIEKTLSITPKLRKIKGKKIIQQPKVSFAKIGAIPIQIKTGAFAGKGLYERTEEVASIIPKTPFAQGVIQRIAIVPRERIAIVPRERIAIVPRGELIFEQFQGTNLLIPNTPRPKPRPQTPERPGIKIFKPTLPDYFKQRKRRFGFGLGGKGFVVEVRRRGKFIPKIRATSPEVALATGKTIARQTLAASFRIKDIASGRLIPLIPGAEFRAGRRDQFTLVQKKTARLRDIGERREIVRARRGGLFI